MVTSDGTDTSTACYPFYKETAQHDAQLQKDPSIPHHSVFTSETALAEKEHVGCQLEHQT
jgi:hypothetical protein